MRYMLLIYGNEAAEASLGEAEREAMFGAHMAYARAMAEAGVMRAGDPLLPTSAATTVRSSGGKVVTTHGPFAETAEQLGGYYIIECASLDEALAWAGQCPSTTYGSVEVRPIMDM